MEIDASDRFVRAHVIHGGLPLTFAVRYSSCNPLPAVFIRIAKKDGSTLSKAQLVHRLMRVDHHRGDLADGDPQARRA
jgi:hypothetical protein